MAELPTIIFLHIPKTAGQSVHQFLVTLFPKRSISPSRVNEQLVKMSIPEIRKHTIFSGHLDWALLDCLSGPRFVFTVLREPTDRILSFYFFLRKSAAALPDSQLCLPHNQGMRAALKLTCDEYFVSGDPGLRTFLDNHYDNFYTHFLAGRTYDSRQRIVAQKRADSTFTDTKIVDLALQNLSVLDGVYPLDRLDLLERDLRGIAGESAPCKSLASFHMNQGDSGDRAARWERLRALGATAKTFNRIREMTALDSAIWTHVQRTTAARI